MWRPGWQGCCASGHSGEGSSAGGRSSGGSLMQEGRVVGSGAGGRVRRKWGSSSHGQSGEGFRGRGMPSAPAAGDTTRVAEKEGMARGDTLMRGERARTAWASTRIAARASAAAVAAPAPEKEGAVSVDAIADAIAEEKAPAAHTPAWGATVAATRVTTAVGVARTPAWGGQQRRWWCRRQRGSRARPRGGQQQRPQQHAYPCQHGLLVPLQAKRGGWKRPREVPR
jgi:hypothetical protein